MADAEVHDVGRIVSVFGGNKRRNRWLLASDTTVFNVCGRSILDLRLAETRSDRVEMTVLAVLGSVMVVVPEGSDVRLSGSSFLASSDCLVEHTGEASHLPPIMVTATTVLGRMIVKSLPYGVDAFPVKRKRVKKLTGRLGSRVRARSRVRDGHDAVAAPAPTWVFDADDDQTPAASLVIESEHGDGPEHGDGVSSALAEGSTRQARASAERDPASEEPAAYGPVDENFWPAGADGPGDASTDAAASGAVQVETAPPAWAEERPDTPDPWPAREAASGLAPQPPTDETVANLPQASTLPAPTVMDEPFDPAQFVAAAKTTA